jgi:hypothetical protein
MTNADNLTIADTRPMIVKLSEHKRTLVQDMYAPPVTLGIPQKDTPEGKRYLAMDACIRNVLSRFNNDSTFTAFPAFVGYSLLSNVAQEALIRAGVEAVADDMTRKPIELYYDEDDNEKGEKLINDLNADMVKFKVKETMNNAQLKDGFFGGCLVYIDVGNLSDEQKMKPLTLDKRTFNEGSLRGFKVIEPVNIAAGDYNTTDPTDEHFFNPEWYYILGKRYHASRFLYIAENDAPLLLKPAYNFFGIPQAQLALDYVAHFVANRESAQELLNKFSLTCFGTDMAQALQQNGSWFDLVNRVKALNKFKTNNGTLVFDKETEQLLQLNTPLGGIADIVKMSLNLLTAIWRIPKIIYIGEGEGGLNASSQEQLRTYYAYIHSLQEKVFTTPYEKIIKILQLNRGLEPDEKLLFKFPSLWDMDDKERADLNKAQADRDAIYIDRGVLSQEECRKRLAMDRYSGYNDIDVDDLPEPQQQPLEQVNEEKDEKDDKPAQDMAMDGYLTEDGRWITIGARKKGENGEDDEGRKGRHIYLEDGETPEEAVEELKKDDKKDKKPEEKKDEPEKKDESEQKEPDKKSDASSMTDEEIAQRHAEYSKKAMELLRKGREAEKDSEEYKDIQKQLKELQDEYDDVLTEREKRANKNNVFVNTSGQEKETQKEEKSDSGKKFDLSNKTEQEINERYAELMDKYDSNNPDKDVAEEMEAIEKEFIKRHNEEEAKKKAERPEKIRKMLEKASFGKISKETATEIKGALSENFKEFEDVADVVVGVGSIQAMSKEDQKNALIDNKEKVESTIKATEDSYFKSMGEEGIARQFGSVEEFRKRVRNIVERRIKKAAQIKAGNETAHFSWDMESKKGHIRFNENVINKGHFKLMQEYAAESGFHPPKCDNIKATADHEFGHAIERYILEKNQNAQSYKELKRFYDDLWQKDEIGTKLSKYGSTNFSDFIAEGYSEYKNNKPPREVAQKIGELLTKAYMEAKNG